MREFSLFILCFLSVFVYGQKEENVPDQEKKNTIILGITGAAIYTGTMVGLNELWYKDFPRSSFHSFDDSREWLQMDKMGHLMTSYYVGYVGHESFKAMGLSDQKSTAWGGCMGLFFLTGVEILDGFSSEWGFSWTDQGFNTAGAALFIGQELAWKEQRIKLKFSYSNTDYPAFNPMLLGSNQSERILKDYNGQTYWASANISNFLNDDSSRFPKWLNLAFGYGADGMVGGHNNDILIDYVPETNFRRSRQYYLSLDIDLTKIESKSKVFNVLKRSFGFIKIPAPTLEYIDSGSYKFHWLYF